EGNFAEFSRALAVLSGKAVVGAPPGHTRQKSHDEVSGDVLGPTQEFGEFVAAMSSGEREDDEAALEKLKANSVSSPLASSVMLPNTYHSSRDLKGITEEDDEVDTVSAPLTIYFDSVPDRDAAEKILAGLLIGKNRAFTTNQLKLVLNYLFDPTQDEMPKAGFDFNDFARKLAACATSSAQRKLLNQMEVEYGDAWDSDEDETLAAASVPETRVYFETTDDNDRARAEGVLSELVPSSDSAIEHLQKTLDLLYQSSTLPSVEILNKIARELDELTSSDAKEGYLITLQEELSGGLEAGSKGGQSETE
ncbi:MAG: hypothetical protein K2Q34_01615, partial [Alphaproteobacteria bacterium]|nr:hypothetical protein [Alphaproteobacteria bacterium]